jgi:hypothetical protein
MTRKNFVLALLIIVAVVLVVEVAGPIIQSYTPYQAHAWISNFGGGLLIAVLATAAITYYFVDPERRLVTPTRITVVLIGFLLLVIFRPDADCQVEFQGRRNSIVCD